MTPLDRLRELNVGATKGPWRTFQLLPEAPNEVSIWSEHWKLADWIRAADAALIAESRNALPNLLTLEALARDEHDQRCGCTGEACKLGEVLRVLDGEVGGADG